MQSVSAGQTPLWGFCARQRRLQTGGDAWETNEPGCALHKNPWPLVPKVALPAAKLTVKGVAISKKSINLQNRSHRWTSHHS